MKQKKNRRRLETARLKDCRVSSYVRKTEVEPEKWTLSEGVTSRL